MRDEAKRIVKTLNDADATLRADLAAKEEEIAELTAERKAFPKCAWFREEQCTCPSCRDAVKEIARLREMLEALVFAVEQTLTPSHSPTVCRLAKKARAALVQPIGGEQ